MNAKDITAQQLRKLIIDIRNEKLPNPNDIGSAGSFFMNPIVSEEKFVALYQQYPTIPHYPAKNGIKLSAGWLIDQAGWKGKKFKNAGVYEKQRGRDRLFGYQYAWHGRTFSCGKNPYGLSGLQDRVLHRL